MADFQSQYSEFEKENIRVLAATAEPLDKAREFAKELGLTYPVGYGLELEETSRLTGAFFERERHILHGTDFLLLPGGKVKAASYSNSAIGRFTAADTLMLAKFFMNQK